MGFPEQSPLRITNPQSECLSQLLGTDVARPRLSWQLESGKKGTVQVSYRIKAASSPEKLQKKHDLLWDTGFVEDPATFDIPYGGHPPRSQQRIWWQVEVADNHGRTALSEPTWFETGLNKPSDWQAQWIDIEGDCARADREAGVNWIWSDNIKDGRLHAFRLDFDAPEDLEKAEVFVACKDRLRGLWVNGTYAATKALTDGHGGWGMVSAITCDIQPGHNSICVAAEADVEGFFPPTGGAMAALIRLHRSNGETERHTSDTSWRLCIEPEDQWTEQDFDASSWQTAQESTSLAAHGSPLPCEVPMLARAEFTAKKEVVSARLYATALGAYDAEINGTLVSDAILSPEISVTKSHTFYQIFDVTDLVKEGENAIGFTVADGFYAGPFTWHYIRYGFGPAPRRLLSQLTIEYSDGSTQVVGTGSDWKITTSPFLKASIYDGEIYDARLEKNGWSQPGFDTAGWQNARVGATPETELKPLVSPPVRPQFEKKAVAVSEPKPGVYVFDFGQNFSGWARLKVAGERGAEITLRYAELQHEDGHANQSNLRRAEATDHYILSGSVEETYEPRFTYHGFRYVQVEGYPGKPSLDDIVGIVVHSDCEVTGQMQFANPLLDKFWHNALWSQRSNFFCVPTDCPQRDERMGWMGDIQIFMDAAAFNMDIDAFIRRFLKEARAAQRPDGAYPIVVPQPLSFPDVVTAGWSEAGIILPYFLWQRYGDTAVIDENWEAMEKWMTYLSSQNPDFIWRSGRGIDLGDWLSVDAINPADETTPRVLCGTAYWAWCADLMVQMARITNRTAKIEKYSSLLKSIQQAARHEFISDEGVCANGSQTSQVLSIFMGLVPDYLKQAAAKVLADEIRGRGTKLSTGFLGTPYLLDVLADAGYWDIVSELLLQEEYPSWGYMVSKGATTMWERWNSDTTEQQMNSYNHYAFGAVVGFFYRRLAGIAPAEPGFRKIAIRPKFLPDIGRVAADYQSCVGPISTVIDGDDEGISLLDVTIPANCTAVIELPAGFTWQEGETPIASEPGDDGLLLIEVGSGKYRFTR